MKNFKSKNGFSMVEVLVASAFVAVLAVTGLTSYTYMRNMRNRSTDVCRIHVSSVVEKFRSIGYFSAINNKTPVSTDRTFNDIGGPTSLQSKGISDTALWPSVNILASGGSPTLNNSILISSSINALLAIYNSNPAYCSTGAPYAGVIANPSGDLNGASISLQIVPFNINTGIPLSTCPNPLRIAPDSTSASAYLTSPRKATQSTDTRNDVGLLLRVNESYTNEDGQTSNCSIEQRFQYSPDITPPQAPNFKQIIPTLTSAPDCSAAITDFTVVFGYNGRSIEPGSVLVCRDMSAINNSVVSPYLLVTCQNGTVTQALAMAGPPMAKPTGVTGLDYTAGYSARAVGTNEWKPCEEVTACGIPPNLGAGLDPASTPQEPRYRLSYSGLPIGCRINIEVAAIDTASNSSDNYLTAGTPPNNTSFNYNMTSISWDVHRPACGSICGPMGSGTGTTAGNTYFRCGGCP